MHTVTLDLSRLLTWCRAELAWQVATIEALARIESPSHDKAAVDRCGVELARRLREIGGRVTLIPSDVGDHVRAEFGEGEEQVLLLGHFDTVWPIGTLERMPVVQKDGRVTGRVRAARQKLGMIFQQFNLVGRLSLFFNVMLGALGRIPGWRGLLGAWPSADKHKAMAALHRVGVADYAPQRANTLSGGQQQRGAIARALVQGAQAILADEPVASLDPVSARKVMELLVELNQRDGLGVIVTLHQVDYAIRYCERVIALQAGKVVYDGPSSGLDTKTLIDIYGPEFEDAFWETKA